MSSATSPTPRWPAQARAAAVVAACCGSLSCSNASSIPDFGPPRVDRIIVFYPVAGLVRGRGLTEAMPLGPSHVVIKAHPNGSETIREVDRDGAFSFEIVARGGDVLEIAGATDRSGASRGEPVFIKVPPSTFSNRDYVCCFEAGASSGTCQTRDEREEQLQRVDGMIACPDPLIRTTCTLDEQCGFEEGEWLAIDLNRINVTAPNRNKAVDVTGTVQPRALVTLQNRGLAGVGQPSTQVVRGTVSGDDGRFEISGIPARGDDELIVQVQDLNGIRSPSVSLLVRDAPIEGLDVTGAFPWRPLRDGEAGTVALQIAPYGVDQRGLCPDHQQAPQTCFTGGLTHDMVTIENLTVDGQGSAAGVSWIPTPITPDLPANRGYDGDVRAGPLSIVLVLDRSRNASVAGITENERTVEALNELVNGLRQRDRVGAVYFGPGVRRLGVAYDSTDRPTTSGLFEGGTERASLLTSIRTALLQPGSGDPSLFEGILEAAKMINSSDRPGRIVVITAEEHAGSVEDSELAYVEAFEAAENANDVTRPPTRVDIVGVSLIRTNKFEDLQAITSFTGGEYYDLSSVEAGGVNQLALLLSDIRGTFSGSFLLLYDITIPTGVGKAARLEFDARMNGVPQAVPYSGLLRVDLAAN